MKKGKKAAGCLQTTLIPLAFFHFSLFISLCAIFSSCIAQKTQISENPDNKTAKSQEAENLKYAHEVMSALFFAYPDRISTPEFIDGDWTFLIDGKRFFYTEGRILPEKERSNKDDYGALLIWNNYTAELPWEDSYTQRPMRRHYGAFGRPRTNYFYEALWNMNDRNTSYRQQVKIDFLGHSLTINSKIRQKVKQIESIILNEAKTDPDVKKWVDSLGTVEGWTWRSVPTSGNRSFHSYGIAIDLLPKNLGGKATYWLWSSQHDPNWYNIPYSERYHPPDIVIKTFESFGFIWGGKWRQYFDTMHFEYRPEVFILSGVPMSNFYLWDM